MTTSTCGPDADDLVGHLICGKCGAAHIPLNEQESRADVPGDTDPSRPEQVGPDLSVCEACNQPAVHTLPRRPTIDDDYTINVGPCCDPDLHEPCEHIT